LNGKLIQWRHSKERNTLATPNYGYEKRQKELAKKRKKEDKLKAKSEKRTDSPDSLSEDLLEDEIEQLPASDVPPQP
jgi:hypothetical protein